MEQILIHTPTWVFGLFFGLVALGVQQSKAREVSLQRFILLPLAMLALSLYGVWSTFNGSALALACWLGAVAATAIAAQVLNFHRGVRFLAESRSFVIPGSWLPLVLMMGIFFTKYAVGIVLARHGELRELEIFLAIVSLVYGFWSGMFLGRTARILAMHRHSLLANVPA